MLYVLIIAVFIGLKSDAQNINFTEYDLPNGLHVILHADHHAPVVAVSVTYHVGSKNEVPGRTGFAHFFEHLMFEGTENIKRGEFYKIVAAEGGQNNAKTTPDLTFYFELFPSNNFKAALWMESERMLHPVINEIGVKTQAEVVKEEKRLRFDNVPYGNAANDVLEKLFIKHPYRNATIGSMRDIDAAKLDEFKAFFNQFYVPGNAVLSIAGDIDIPGAKQLIAAYFGNIPRGKKVVYDKVMEAPIVTQLVDTVYDFNIPLNGIVAAYRTPNLNSRESKIFDMIAAVLSEGESSRLYKKMVNDKKDALRVLTYNYNLEDYGAYMIAALPNRGATLPGLLADIDQEIKILQTDLITEKEYQKIKNRLEVSFIGTNPNMLSIAENLARGYLLYNSNTNHINEELDEIRSITREEIRETARKCLNRQQRLVVYYLPAKK